MLEYWLINARIDKDDFLIGANIEMLSHNIGEEKKEGQGIELSCNDMILLQRSSTSYCSGMENLTDSKEQQQF